MGPSLISLTGLALIPPPRKPSPALLFANHWAGVLASPGSDNSLCYYSRNAQTSGFSGSSSTAKAFLRRADNKRMGVTHRVKKGLLGGAERGFTLPEVLVTVCRTKHKTS
jgi:hypothetical protein